MWTNITHALKFVQQSNDNIAFYYKISINLIQTFLFHSCYHFACSFCIIRCFAHKTPFLSFSIGPILVHCVFQNSISMNKQWPIFCSINFKFSIIFAKLVINSRQDIELKTLDYKSKVINFLQLLFCERHVCLKVNFTIQQNLFCSGI